MHELSIAMSIVEICAEEVSKASAKRVCRVEVEVGTMSGVVAEALEFAWDPAAQGSCAEDAELIIIQTEAMARCKACGAEFGVDSFYDACPACSDFGYDIIKGNELRVKSVTVE